MKSFFLLALACMGFSACSSPDYNKDHGGTTRQEAADGSSSPVSQDQAWAVARAAVTARENWPAHQLGDDKLIHTVSFGAKRINNGGWKVVAHRSVMENREGDSRSVVYDPIPAAIIVINNRGALASYSHRLTDPYTDE